MKLVSALMATAMGAGAMIFPALWQKLVCVAGATIALLFCFLFRERN